MNSALIWFLGMLVIVVLVVGIDLLYHWINGKK